MGGPAGVAARPADPEATAVLSKIPAQTGHVSPAARGTVQIIPAVAPAQARPRAETAPHEGPGGKSSVGRNTALMSFGTIASRGLGMVRSALLAAAIGQVTIAANMFQLGNSLSTYIYSLIAEGLFSAILIPQIMRAYQMRHGQVFLNKLLTLTLSALAVLTVLMTIGAGWLVWLYGGKKVPADQLALATAFAYWCMPQLFFYGLYAVYGQVLNSRGRFGAYMWAPAINNVISIIGFGAFMVLFGTNKTTCPNPGDPTTYCAANDLSIWTGPRVVLLGVTATLGVVMQAIVLIRPLRKSGFRWHLNFNPRGSGLRAPAKMAVWTLGTVLVVSLGNILVTNITTSAGSVPGREIAGNASYSAAAMVYILPHAVVSMSLLTAIFPSMSAAAARGDVVRVRAGLSRGMRNLGVFTPFAAAVLLVLALPITRAIYPGNTPTEVNLTAQVVAALALNLVPLGATVLLRRTFYAFEDSRSVFFIQIAMTLLLSAQIGLIWWLVPMQWWTVGVGIATTVMNSVEVLVRSRTMSHRLHGMDGARITRLYVRCGVAALAVGLAGWAVLHTLPDLGVGRWWMSIVTCAVIGILMGLLYLMALSAMRVHELDSVLRPFWRRGYRSSARHVRRR